MKRSGTNPNYESVEEMDVQILTLEVQLADLKERRNRRASPLCYMPEEVVAQILVHAQQLFVPRSLRSWLRILPLCRRIWTIALRWPDLWSMYYVDSSMGGNAKSSANLGDWQRLELCRRRGPENGLIFHVDNGLSSEQAKHLSSHARSLILDRSFGKSTVVDLEGLKSTSTTAPEWHLLRILRIYVNPKPNGTSINIGILIPGQSHHSLTTLHLACGPYHLEGVPCLPQLRYLGIRHLEIRPFDDLRLHELLSETNHLIQCSLHITFGGGDETIPWIVNHNHARLSLPQLCNLELWGPADVVCTILDMFPDPSEELSLHMTDDPRSTSDEQEQVVDRALAFLADRSRNTRRPIEYEIEFTSGGSFMNFGLGSYILPDGDLLYTPLNLTATCKHRATLAQAMRYAKRVVFHGECNFDQTFAALERSGADVQEVHFTSKWRNRWGRLPMVERYLKARKEAGNPLATIRIDKAEWMELFPDVMDVDIVGLGIQSRWLKEGLVMNAIVGENA